MLSKCAADTYPDTYPDTFLRDVPVITSRIESASGPIKIQEACGIPLQSGCMHAPLYVRTCTHTCTCAHICTCVVCSSLVVLVCCSTAVLLCCRAAALPCCFAAVLLCCGAAGLLPTYSTIFIFLNANFRCPSGVCDIH